jgi:hypothetical protein
MRHTQSRWPWTWCEIIPDEKVQPAYMVPLAKAVVDWAAQDLSLKNPPKVVWFMRHKGLPPALQTDGKTEIDLSPEQYFLIRLNMDSLKKSGCFFREYPDVVFIKIRRCPFNLAQTVLHEVRHAWQHQAGWSFSETRTKGGKRPAEEVDAAAYVRPLLQQMIPLIGRFSPRE